MSRNAEGKSQRSFVIEDDVWYASLVATKAEGTTVSAVIRDALIAFTESHPAPKAAVRKAAAASRAVGAVSRERQAARPVARKATRKGATK